MSSRGRSLTEQFYEWERRGRGWDAFGKPVQLEPAFVPFFGHFVAGGIIDDGKRPGFLSRLKGCLAPKQAPAMAEAPEDEGIAVPDDEGPPPLAIYGVAIPKGYALKGETMERFLTMLALCREPVSFELIAERETFSIQVACSEDIAPFIHIQLSSYFPECAVHEKQADAVLDWANERPAVSTVDFGLQEECLRPIATLRGGYDPYTPLFGTFERLKDDEAIIVQVLFCGALNAWGESVVRAAGDGIGGSFFIDAPEMPQLAKEKTSQPLFFANVRIAAFADRVQNAAALLQHSAVAVVHASTSHHNALQPLNTPAYTIDQRLSDLALRQSHRLGMLLNASELSTFVHLPSTQLSKKLLRQHRATRQAPPHLINSSYILGLNEHQGQEFAVGIGTDQRLKHIHIMGATGTGKSTLLHSLMMQDIAAGNGMMCLDPHGDLIAGLLSNVPASRINDVVLVDPTDSEFPIGLNILEAHTDVEREILASDLAAVFRRFSTSFGDQMYSVLSNAILALLFNAKTYHLGDLRKFLIEPSYRNNILSNVTDPDIAYYWQKEYPLLKAGGSVGPILTRLDSFLRPKVIRAMVCQTRSIDFGALMDSGKIILVKLSQGLIGAENSYLLGAFVVAKLQQAAMARQSQAVEHRRPFFCYIDEFHNFVTPSMAAIVSGARKYGLGLVLAHQDMQQVQKHDMEVASSVLANAATRICFRLAETEAKRMQEGFASFSMEDLQNLRVGEAIARVNTADADFNLAIVPRDASREADNTDAIVANSRLRYSVPVMPVAPAEPIAADAQALVKIPEARPLPQAMPIPVRIEPIEPSATTQLAREHRYTQAFIKTLAEEHGYIAHLEVPTPDGNGQVDVLLEKAGKRIAVELSVTNTPEYELKNIQKCLSAGYESVVCCCANKKKLAAIKKLVTAAVPVADMGKITFGTVEDFHSILTAEPQQPPKPQHTVMKGYRVKVRYQEGGVNQQALLQSIVNGSRK
ncbi:type IV secretion system DNA-binding domain-containing protein [Mucilaginibacter sp. ZT4R22]|uniref:Type IV secretion system DNA-binding domain-containing protein n=1 Tax=Mucilaginibacter pankratovii TaxID=2772110 RepID=A0ABR7WMC6_9SPHI|nr:type IV secretion system DNA-binding domain-containing protein [Mucilaginibacter pankratovii]MBD1363480.1 type IV secretion system DNA-binding domain-containing protein [Mucilaginibacter pankratovii]